MPNLCIIGFIRVFNGRQGVGILRRCTVLGVCNNKPKPMTLSFSLPFSSIQMFIKDLYWLSHILLPLAIENIALGLSQLMQTGDEELYIGWKSD